MATNSMILIIGEEGDWSADAVAVELDAQGIRHCMMDTADFPQRMRFTGIFDQHWTGVVETPGGTLHLEDITAVYYRKPRDFDLPAELSGPERRFARAQARVGIGGVLTSLRHVRWMNSPSVIADCEYKPAQLWLARLSGLEPPPTLITNSPTDMHSFAKMVGPDLIVKPLAEPIVHEAGGHTAVYTRRLTTADLVDLEGIETTAHLIQPFIPKSFEARITAIGSTCLFSVAIRAGSEESSVDWRSDYSSLSYEVIQPPACIADGIAQYMDFAGLRYAAFDFVITPENRWVFLESNSAGQWGWLAQECELPIAAAIAHELARK